MDVLLVVVDGPRAGLRFRSRGREAITVGRSRTNDFHVLDSSMSRVHAVVARDAQGWYVEDQKSRNGVWSGGERVERLRLHGGETFHLGKLTALRFELVPAEQDESGVFLPTLRCASCGAGLAEAEVVRGADGRPYHLRCRNLDHLVGTELGEFRVAERIDPLGEGFFFRAHQPTLNRTVTLEVFDPPLMARPGFRQALLEEVRRASRFLHPNILQIYDFGEGRGMAFVVVEHFRGQPLARVLEERRFVKIRAAISVACQVVEALVYAREQGAALAWIGTSQVLVSPEDEVKVRIFQEPRLDDADRPRRAEAAYVAPEVLRGDRGREETTLVYSVGAMLYHMLAGIPPFEGDTTAELTRRALHESPPGLRRINLKVGPALAKCVEDALDRDPGNRPSTLQGLLAGLRRAGGR